MREGVTHGTVPYLGTFLTDLMMIDTAFPDKIKVCLQIHQSGVCPPSLKIAWDLVYPVYFWNMRENWLV